MPKEDLEELAKDFGLTVEEFIDRYIKPTVETILERDKEKPCTEA